MPIYYLILKYIFAKKLLLHVIIVYADHNDCTQLC